MFWFEPQGTASHWPTTWAGQCTAFGLHHLARAGRPPSVAAIASRRGGGSAKEHLGALHAIKQNQLSSSVSIQLKALRNEARAQLWSDARGV